MKITLNNIILQLIIYLSVLPLLCLLFATKQNKEIDKLLLSLKN